MQRDDREMGKVLVVEELREAFVHLRHPELEDVLAARQRFASVLDEELVLRVVVDVWRRDGDLGEEPDGMDRHREGDQEREADVPRGAAIGDGIA